MKPRLKNMLNEAWKILLNFFGLFRFTVCNMQTFEIMQGLFLKLFTLLY